MGKEPRKHRKDRRDAWYLADMDSMHVFMAGLLPGRTANEAVMNETVDLTAIERYLEKKNAEGPAFKYTFFHVICAATAKTIALRPALNRFIANGRFYQRKQISLAFIVKKQFVDNGAESLAIVVLDPESGVSPLEQIHREVERQVTEIRVKDQKDGTTDIMDKLVKLPRFLFNLVIRAFRWMDRTGRMPDSLQKVDPYYTSCFLSNLGSIKMHATYHHLAEYGTNSFFMLIGEKHKAPFFAEDGSYELRDVLDLGMTLDERVADGTYYAKSVRLMRKLLAEPELLDRPMSEIPEY